MKVKRAVVHTETFRILMKNYVQVDKYYLLITSQEYF